MDNSDGLPSSHDSSNGSFFAESSDCLSTFVDFEDFFGDDSHDFSNSSGFENELGAQDLPESSGYGNSMQFPDGSGFENSEQFREHSGLEQTRVQNMVYNQSIPESSGLQFPRSSNFGDTPENVNDRQQGSGFESLGFKKITGDEDIVDNQNFSKNSAYVNPMQFPSGSSFGNIMGNVSDYQQGSGFESSMQFQESSGFEKTTGVQSMIDDQNFPESSDHRNAMEFLKGSSFGNTLENVNDRQQDCGFENTVQFQESSEFERSTQVQNMADSQNFSQSSGYGITLGNINGRQYGSHFESSMQFGESSGFRKTMGVQNVNFPESSSYKNPMQSPKGSSFGSTLGNVNDCQRDLSCENLVQFQESSKIEKTNEVQNMVHSQNFPESSGYGNSMQFPNVSSFGNITSQNINDPQEGSSFENLVQFQESSRYEKTTRVQQSSDLENLAQFQESSEFENTTGIQNVIDSQNFPTSSRGLHSEVQYQENLGFGNSSQGEAQNVFISPSLPESSGFGNQLHVPSPGILRQIMHSNGKQGINLQIHGIIGSFFSYAVLHTFDYSSKLRDIKFTNLSRKSLSEVKKFLTQHCENYRRLGYKLMKDELSEFYQTLSVGLYSENDNIAAASASASDNVMGQSGFIDSLPGQQSQPDQNNVGQEEAGTQSQPDQNSVGQEEAGTSRTKPNFKEQRQRIKKMTFQDLRPYFHLRLQDAAEEVNVCASVLKNIAREAGTGWPHKKLKGIESSIEKKEKKLLNGCNDEDESAKIRKEIEELKEERQNIYMGNVPRKKKIKIKKKNIKIGNSSHQLRIK